MAINLFDLTGRRALVTGSSQGIGFALARGLTEAGAEVVLNGRDGVKLATAAGSIAGARTLAFDARECRVERFEQFSIERIAFAAGHQQQRHAIVLFELNHWPKPPRVI